MYFGFVELYIKVQQFNEILYEISSSQENKEILSIALWRFLSVQIFIRTFLSSMEDVRRMGR